jgi:hypothetical protein
VTEGDLEEGIIEVINNQILKIRVWSIAYYSFFRNVMIMYFFINGDYQFSAFFRFV